MGQFPIGFDSIYGILVLVGLAIIVLGLSLIGLKLLWRFFSFVAAELAKALDWVQELPYGTEILLIVIGVLIVLLTMIVWRLSDPLLEFADGLVDQLLVVIPL